MEKVIREGTLRLHTNETTCDIILTCDGERLMAHKLILSIASPVFRDILHKNPDSTIVILPEIKAGTMSLVLDYIYTGTSAVYSKNIQDFVSLVKFFQIELNDKYLDNILEGKNYIFDETVEKKEDINYSKDLANNNITDRFSRDTKKLLKDDKSFIKNDETKIASAEHVKIKQDQTTRNKTRKKLPNLLPLLNISKTQSKPSNLVIPSPWCPRFGALFMEDPRKVYFKSAECGMPGRNLMKKSQEDDNNNNSTSTNDPHQTSPRYVPGKLDNVIRNLHLSNNIYKIKTGHKENGNLDIFNSNNKIIQSSDRIATDTSLCRSNSCQKLSNTEEKIELERIGTCEKVLSSLLANGERRKSCNSDLILNLSDKSSSKSRELIAETNQNSNSNKRSKVQISILNETDINDHSTNLTRDLNEYQKHKNPLVTETPVKTNTDVECALSDNKDSLELDGSIDSCLDSDGSDSSKKSETEGGSWRNEEEIPRKKRNKNEIDTKADKKKKFQCVDCQKSFSQLRNYKYHRSLHEGTKEFSAKCLECGKTFNDRGYLSSHMKIHRDKKEYACQHCPKRFNQRVAYNMHLRIHTGLKPHQCPTCEKSFSRKMLLKQHQRVHTGERPYSCPECGKSFADRSNMSLHARLHTGVKPYACELCPKSFTKKHHLKTHMNFHTGLKPYACENCGLTFSQSSNMRTHYKKCILKKDEDMHESTKSRCGA